MRRPIKFQRNRGGYKNALIKGKSSIFISAYGIKNRIWRVRAGEDFYNRAFRSAEYFL
jgi:hypothetical protein